MKSSDILLPQIRPDSNTFREDIIEGLLREEKRIPCKYLYDHQGSMLFEKICTLEEYYIPGIENEIMRTRIEEIACCVDGEQLHLVDYGCGDCSKARLLMDRLAGLTSYVPVDISLEQLRVTAGDIDAAYPGLLVLPVCADYTREFSLPISSEEASRIVVYFPGSTIGNFDPPDAFAFLERIAKSCGVGGGLLIGVDMKKDPRVLHRAYNDGSGITAAFNLNLLERIRRELGWDIRVDDFEHYAFYSPRYGRMEMHLISMREQEVDTGKGTIHFDEGESIWTESSYKYGLGEFEELAAAAGFKPVRSWSDDKQWFSVHYMLNEGV